MRTVASWRALLRLLEGSGRVVAGSVAISLVQAALLVPIAFLVREVFNSSVPDGDTSGVLRAGLVVLALLVASSAAGLATRWLALRATKKAIATLRVDLLEKVMMLPRSYLDRRDLGSLHSLIVQDSERLDATAYAVVSILLPTAIVSAALCVALVALDALLAVLVIVTIPVMTLAARPFGEMVRRRTRAWHRSFDRFSSRTMLSLRSSTLTKLHGAEKVELEGRAREAVEVSETGRTMLWAQAAHAGITTFISAVVGVIVLVVGGIAVAEDRMGLGDLLAFYAVLGLLRTQLSLASVAAPQAVSGIESLARLQEFLGEDAREPYRGSRRIDFAGGVELRGVTFAYEPSRPVLRGADLTVDRGETVLLLGHNGAGKSTVISLIAGLYAPDEGVVAADGVPLAELEMASLRAQMGVVTQNPLMLPTTIGENIAFGRPDATSREVESAADRAGAAGFIAGLPAGYETAIGDEGVRLSGGQLQRIALARALLGEPALLMLDEPSTHLDREGTRALLESLRAGLGPAVLVVSHEVELTDGADRVVELRDGAIGPVSESGGSPAPAAEGRPA